MLCTACGGELILTNVVPDETVVVHGVEQHTFVCSTCYVTERNVAFTKHGREDDSPPMPMQAAHIKASGSDAGGGQYRSNSLGSLGPRDSSNPGPVVLVDGRILNRQGKLVHLDPQMIAREAAAANAALRKRAGWW